MRLLLLRPAPVDDRFGLGPFFAVEPLGLEYLGATLLARGHEVVVADLRFRPRLRKLSGAAGFGLVGISCIHSIDVPAVRRLAAEVRRLWPQALIVVGGHAVGIAPSSFFDASIDAVCVVDGEVALTELVRQHEAGQSLNVAGVFTRLAPGSGPGVFRAPAEAPEPRAVELAPLPARHLVARYRNHYACVHKMPLWAVETARGCPHQCHFCSTANRYGRTQRVRAVSQVVDDFVSIGNNVFVVDDLFFHPHERSRELAVALRERAVSKDWILVQARADGVARHPETVAAWRDLAQQLDVFFGFEAPTQAGLDALGKNASVQDTEEAVRVCRDLGVGVTGNFVIDPKWGEPEFEALFALLERLRLDRAGFTILTPLPGTRLQSDAPPFESWLDMSHTWTTPRLGFERFFELYAECWRSNVLASKHASHRWRRWLKGLRPGQILRLARTLHRTQRLVSARAYLQEHAGFAPAALAAPNG